MTNRKNANPILPLLEKPHDIANLSLSERQQLAQEIRQVMIDTVAANGGHLGANLGTVELAIALHAVFDSPKDKLVWDVGHQAYPHKLLTGRLSAFGTLRKKGGLSGFLRRTESEHDAFGAGHASTSISAAMGMAKARDLQGSTHKVIAIIGDGALTGGLAYEALNHAGAAGTDLIVILNDNTWSISPNVGAISNYLTKMRSAPAYSRIKQDVQHAMKRIPLIGESVAKTAEKVKDGVRYVFVPGAFFEELGFRYLGPLDGHDLAHLEEVLLRASKLKGPVLIHVITQKGYGYAPALSQPGKFHAPPSFDPTTGAIKPQPPKPATYSQVFGQTLIDLAKTDSRLVAITAAMADGTGLVGFSQKFPERFFDVGIAEGHATTFAAGLAAAGMKPVFAVYSTFLQRAFDQVIHDVGIQQLPVVLAIDRAGLVGDDGATHHGVFDMAYLAEVPGFVVAAPRDEEELRHILFTATKSDKPFALRYPKANSRGNPWQGPYREIPIGTAESLRQGPDGVIMAIGSMVAPSLEAAILLAEDGIDVEVIDLRYVKPLDQKAIEIAAKKPFILTVEEGTLIGGVGMRIQCMLGQHPHVEILGIPDEFVEHGSRVELLQELGLSATGIAERARELHRRVVYAP